MSEKPPYRVPSMAEIAAVPSNGLRLVSTFSGCGGSCLGFKMAGFRVLWASEFVQAAQETYRANHPDTPLDTRDIRLVQPEDILSKVGLEAGELDVLEGSPPCASFSTAGKREAGWGKVKTYSDTKQRTDDLFFEFARILEGLQPKVFVAENVSGLVKGTAKGYFKEILRALRECGYTVEARLLDAQWLGVPQARQRIIFQGVREDLKRAPIWPMPLPYRYSVRDAIPWIRSVKCSDAPNNWKNADIPSPSIVASGAKLSPTVYWSGSYVEAETDISCYAIGREWDNVAIGGQSEKYFSLQKPALDKPCQSITALSGKEGYSQSAASVVHPTEKRKFSIAELKRICGFPDDFILTGTYAQQWERLGRAVPPVMMAHVARCVEEVLLDTRSEGT